MNNDNNKKDLSVIESKPDDMSRRMALLQLYWLPLLAIVLLSQLYFKTAIAITITITISGLILWIVLFSKFYLSAKGKLTKLIESGQALTAEAEILMVEETGARINKKPLLKFNMQLKTPKSSPYVVMHSQTAPLLKLADIKVGSILKVAIDPDNPKLMKIIWE